MQAERVNLFFTLEATLVAALLCFVVVELVILWKRYRENKDKYIVDDLNRYATLVFDLVTLFTGAAIVEVFLRLVFGGIQLGVTNGVYSRFVIAAFVSGVVAVLYGIISILQEASKQIDWTK